MILTEMGGVNVGHKQYFSLKVGFLRLLIRCAAYGAGGMLKAPFHSTLRAVVGGINICDTLNSMNLSTSFLDCAFLFPHAVQTATCSDLIFRIRSPHAAAVCMLTVNSHFDFFRMPYAISVSMESPLQLANATPQGVGHDLLIFYQHQFPNPHKSVASLCCSWPHFEPY